MKQSHKVIFSIVLAIFVFGVLPVPRAFADEPKKDPCAIELKSGQSVPDSFPVGDCLRITSGQPTLEQKEGEPPPVMQFVIKVINLLVRLISSISLIVFIVGALLTIASQGKEDMLEKGKTAMLYAIIGLVVSLMAFVMVTFVQSLLF